MTGKNKPTDRRTLRLDEVFLVLLIKPKNIDLMIPSFVMERTMRDLKEERTVP